MFHFTPFAPAALEKLGEAIQIFKNQPQIDADKR